MLNSKTALLLGALLLCGSGALHAAATAPEPEAPAKPELLVEGGLLGAISSSLDEVQDKLDRMADQPELEPFRTRAEDAGLTPRPNGFDRCG